MLRVIKLAVLLVVTLTLVLVVLQNTATIQARFLWYTAELSVIVLLFVSAAGGFVLGIVAALLAKKTTKTPES